MGCRSVGASVGSRYCGGRVMGQERGDVRHLPVIDMAVSYMCDCKWAASVILVGEVNLACPGCIRKAWFVIITEEPAGAPTVCQWREALPPASADYRDNPSACFF